MATIDLSQAWHRVAQTIRMVESQRLSLEDAYGLVLAEPLKTRSPLPGHDRSMMDGIALRQSDTLYPFVAPHASVPSLASSDSLVWLEVIEEIPAGVVPSRALQSGQAARIMTGAMMPQGADAVVAIEHVILPEASHDQPASFHSAGGSAGVVGIERGTVKPQQNLQRRGAISAADTMVLAAGRRLGAAELGLAAEIGATQLAVLRPIKGAVITTGDELVPADQEPLPSQIRDSNGPMLAAALQHWTGQSVYRTHSRDSAQALDHALAQADRAQADVIVLAGGVSAGKLDLVPDRLVAFGAECHFHKVWMKPGKPIWFGTRDTQTASGQPRRQWFFGLPGNPISSLIGAELFVAPLLRALHRGSFEAPRGVYAKLSREFTHRSDRPTYWPARCELTDEGLHVVPLDWLGSADLPRVAQADGWIAFAAGTHHYSVGTQVRFLRRSC